MAKRLLILLLLIVAVSALIVLAILGVKKLFPSRATPIPAAPTTAAVPTLAQGTSMPTAARVTMPPAAGPTITPNLPQNPGQVVLATAQFAGGVTVQGTVEVQVAEVVLVNKTDETLVVYLPGEPSPITLSPGMTAGRQLPPGTCDVRVLAQATNVEWLSTTVELPNLTRLIIPLSYPILAFYNQGQVALTVRLQPSEQTISLLPGDTRQLTLLPGRYQYTATVQGEGRAVGDDQVDLVNGEVFTVSLGLVEVAPERPTGEALTSALLIENRTTYTLTVSLAGLERQVVVPPLAVSPRLELPPGEYDLQVVVAGGNVAPFTDHVTLEPGMVLTRTYELEGD
jgi:hypothetical protein